MKKKIGLVLLAMMVLSATGCSSSKPAETAAPAEQKTEAAAPAETKAEEAAPAEEVITLKFADTEVPGMPEYEGNLKFIELIETNSNGRIKVEYYPNNQLGGDKEIVAALMAGTVDIGKCAAGNFSDYTDAVLFTDLPGVYKNSAQMRKVWQTDIRDEITAEIQADTGLVPVMFDCDGGSARAIFYNGKDIRVPADCKGMKVRTTGSEVEMALFEELGIAATPMAFTELYMALSQGTIDGIYTNPPGTYSNKLCEVSEKCTIINLSYITTFKLLSESAIEKLGGEGSELYNIVVEAGAEAEVYKDELIAKNNEKVEEQIAGVNCTMIKLTDEEQKQWNDAAAKVCEQFIGDGKLVSQELYDKIMAVE